jgi:hypothetical protein
VPQLDSSRLVAYFTKRNCAISSIQSFSIAKIHRCSKLWYLHPVNCWSGLGLVVTGFYRSSHVLTMCVTNDQTGVRPGETVTDGLLGPVCGYFAVCMTGPKNTMHRCPKNLRGLDLLRCSENVRQGWRGMSNLAEFNH